jgi:sulfoxide reductase heme-binding subunit YedZ
LRAAAPAASRYGAGVPKRATLIKAVVAVLGVLPAVRLWIILERMNPHFVKLHDVRTYSLAIAETGAWAFVFMLITLACTPLRRLTGWRWFGELRRTLGLLAFFHVVMHFFAYLVVGQKLHYEYLLLDALGQYSRIPGWLCLILMIPLAVTSTDGMTRILGGKRWKALHRLVYLATALAIAHLYWTEVDRKSDHHLTRNVAVPFAILMAARLVPKRADAKPPTTSTPAG